MTFKLRQENGSGKIQLFWEGNRIAYNGVTMRRNATRRDDEIANDEVVIGIV